MTNKSLRYKKIVISAAAGGIGWAITKTCLNNGAKVFLCDNNKKLLKKVYLHPLFKKRLFASFVDASNEKEVINFPYRINIDTGCFFSGKLSCVCINDKNKKREFIYS